MNPRLVRECREAGYERVFTIAPSLGLREPDEFETGRVAVDPTDWPIEFRLKLGRSVPVAAANLFIETKNCRKSRTRHLELSRLLDVDPVGTFEALNNGSRWLDYLGFYVLK